MKMGNTSAAIMHNNIDTRYTWPTASIKVKESVRREFILFLVWILMKATLII